MKNPPAMQETQVPSLSQEDPLEKGMTDYPLQYSCLENSMDRRACWATVHGVAKSWMGLSLGIYIIYKLNDTLPLFLLKQTIVS